MYNANLFSNYDAKVLSRLGHIHDGDPMSNKASGKRTSATAILNCRSFCHSSGSHSQPSRP